MASSSPGAALSLSGVCFLIILQICCLRTGVAGSGLQRFVVRPKSVSVLEGEDVTLGCAVLQQEGRVQWTKDGFTLGFERHVPGYPRYTYLGDARLGEHHLVISNVSLPDDGEYQCQVGPTFTNPPIWAGANVTVLKAPGTPVLEGQVLGEVLSGSSVSVVCSSPGDQETTSLRIYKQGQVVAADVEQEGNLTRALARMRVTPADNGAQVECEITSQASRTPKVTSTRLSVLFGPRDVSVSAVPSLAEGGSVVTLTCLTSSSNPPANITWSSHGTHLRAYKTHISPSAFSGSSTRSELQLKVTPEDNGRIFLCQADNGLGSPLQRKLTLKVLHAPVWREVPPPKVDVWEGSDVVITATAVANPGPVRYWWQRGREMLVGAGGELRLGQASRDMTGYYTVSAYSRRGAINNTFFLNVQYGPENLAAPKYVAVSDGENVNIRCSATGNPVPHLIWTNKNHTVGSGVGVARLVLPSAGPDDTGVYLCVAATVPSATHPAKPTKLIVTQAVSVSEEDGPSMRSWVSVGGQGWLVCRVKAHPQPTFTWTSQGHAIHNDNKFTIHKPVLVDGLVSWMSVLEVADVSPVDYRTYLCSSANTLGSDSTTITLRPLTRPLPPVDLKVINVTSVTVTLGWVPNMAGGKPESYTVRYQAASTLNFQYEDVDNTTEVTVGGLQPDQEYSITSQATNRQGSSDYVTPAITFSTLGENDGVGGSGWDEGESHHLTSLLLLANILAAVGLLALSIAIVTCLLRHFRKRRSCIQLTGSTKMTSVTTHGNTSSSSPDSHQHHHQHHHHHLTSLTRTTPKALEHHKELNCVNKLNNAATPVSNNKRRVASKDKPNMQGRADKKLNSMFLHNGRGLQEGPVYTKSNKRNSSDFAQAFLPENRNASNNRTKKSSSVSPETQSLIQHNQEGNLPTIDQIKQSNPEGDQASDSSHESTETVIYLENIPPAPDMKTQLMHEDTSVGFNSLQYNLKQSEVQQYQENEAIQQTIQHEQLPSKTNENNKQAHQAIIMTESQNGIMQRVEQIHPQIHISGEPEVISGSEQPMFSQGSPQPQYQVEHSASGNTICNHLVNSTANAASINILARAHQLSKLNHPGSAPARHMQWKQPPKSPIAPNNPAVSAEDNQQNLIRAFPVRKRFHQPSASPQCQEHQRGSPGRIPNLPVQIKLPKKVQHHLTPSDLPPQVKLLHSRQPSPIRTQLNTPPKSPNQVKQHTPHHSLDIGHHQFPQSRRDHFLNQLAHSPSNPSQNQKLPSPTKRSSQPTPSPSHITQHHSLSPQHSDQCQSLPSSHILQHPQLRSRSPSWHHLVSTPSSSNQHLPPQISPCPSQILHPSSPSHSLHHLLPTPPGSTHGRPPPTPPRQRHQQPSSSPGLDRLPLPGPSTLGPHHHLSSTRLTHYNQNARPTQSRQQSRNTVFTKSTSRSLEDYSSSVDPQNEVYQESPNYTMTQEGNKQEKNVVVGSSAVSTSLPQDINCRHTGHESYTIQMAPASRNLVRILADDLIPAATSSPITSRRQRARFPDDFLWKGSPGK